MARPIHSRSRDPLAAPLVVLALALSPFTAPFSTSDLSDHQKYQIPSGILRL